MNKKPLSYDELVAYFKEKDICYEINNVLTDNSGHKVPDNYVYDITIEWGDWKHDHGYCDYLMSQKGYTKVSELTTEEDGSDTYSSIHRYLFIG